MKTLDIKYLEFHGDIPLETRAKNIELFNGKNNIHGEKYKVILLSSAGLEGLTLTNVKMIHITEPSWNMGQMKQLSGRAVRLNSHAELPPNERNVDFIYYFSITKNSKNLIDSNIYNHAKQKEEIKNQFISIIKSAAVDCELFRKNNMKNEQYNCFHFPVETYIKYIQKENVGPAYNNEINPQGLSTDNSELSAIKVRPVKIHIDNKIINSLLDEKTGIVYDEIIQNIPIGFVEKYPKDISKNMILMYTKQNRLTYK